MMMVIRRIRRIMIVIVIMMDLTHYFATSSQAMEVDQQGNIQSYKYKPESVIVRQMWITPVIIISLFNDLSKSSQHINIDTSTNTKLITKQFLHDLSNSIVEHFDQFRSNRSLVNEYKQQFDLHENALDSDIYFFYQQALVKEKVSSLYNSKYCSDMDTFDFRISKLIYSSIDLYFKESNADPSIIQTLPRDRSRLMIWSSIHSNGSFHESHHHVGSSVSGVLYINIPPGSGSLYFEDPRGRLPPFGHVMRIEPKIGDLILFPGWLVHGVNPTLSTSPRISLSFNYETSWDITSDVSFGYRIG